MEFGTGEHCTSVAQSSKVDTTLSDTLKAQAIPFLGIPLVCSDTELRGEGSSKSSICGRRLAFSRLESGLQVSADLKGWLNEDLYSAYSNLLRFASPDAGKALMKNINSATYWLNALLWEVWFAWIRPQPSTPR